MKTDSGIFTVVCHDSNSQAQQQIKQQTLKLRPISSVNGSCEKSLWWRRNNSASNSIAYNVCLTCMLKSVLKSNGSIMVNGKSGVGICHDGQSNTKFVTYCSAFQFGSWWNFTSTYTYPRMDMYLFRQQCRHPLIIVIIVINHMVSNHCVWFTHQYWYLHCLPFIDVCLIAPSGFIRLFCAIIVSPLTMFDSMNSEINSCGVNFHKNIYNEFKSNIQSNAVIYLDTVPLRQIWALLCPSL